MIFIISFLTLAMIAYSVITVKNMKPLKERQLIPDTSLGKFLRALAILSLFTIMVMSIIAMAFNAHYIRHIVNYDTLTNNYPNHFRSGRSMLAADAFLTLVSTYGLFVVLRRRTW